ncbi:MAG: Gfo/Idh/MocA family oxidoreductase [Bacteroidia bacterium]|nr:Gfo/Idh/MocA family oxidoreductase [Bacteroidia bacterium]
MYKALVVGCGNIGALYDLDNDSVKTHTKAFSKNKLIELWIFDSDKKLSKKIAEKYSCHILNEITSDELKKFDLVSICVPTNYHIQYLNILLKINTKIIICEKPISLIKQELDDIQSVFLESKSKIIVNYIRRFQPVYIYLKNNYSKYLNTESLSEISIKYTRGFLNNVSHAFDLIEFLFDEEINLSKIKVIDKTYDVFLNDPTLSLKGELYTKPIIITGIPHSKTTVWEIELCFTGHKISFSNSGNDIIITSLKNSDCTEIFHATDCIKDYMQPVIDAAVDALNNRVNTYSNFENSLLLNKKMLEYIQ